MAPGGGWRARRISTAVLPLVRTPGPPGRVHSVFASALNLEFHGELVTLARSSTGGLPNGLVLDDEDTPTDLASIGLWPGLAVHRLGDYVRVADVWVDLRPATPWSPVLATRGLRPRAWQEVRPALAQALAHRPVRGGFSPLLGRLAGLAEPSLTRAHGQPAQATTGPVAPAPACLAAGPAIDHLVGAACAEDLPGMLHAAARLIGLGDGLTPSGDDVLVGLGAGLRLANHPLGPAFSLGCARLAQGRTTRVAEMFLDYAARAAFSERVHRLVEALLPGSPVGGVADRLAEGLEWGASSGADTLLGLLLGGYTTPGASIQPISKLVPGAPDISLTSAPASKLSSRA